MHFGELYIPRPMVIYIWCPLNARREKRLALKVAQPLLTELEGLDVTAVGGQRISNPRTLREASPSI